MENRLNKVLQLIVEEYTRTAEPVGSKQLCDRFKLDCSSATVRNDMAALEEQGLIAQPHTSAGRVPTEKGYRLYIQNQQAAKRQVRVRITFRRLTPKPVAISAEERLHGLGLALADQAHEAVMLATNKPWSTVVGLAHLLRQPEFRSGEATLALASMLERFDEAYQDILQTASDEVTVLMGKDSPFGQELSSIVVKSNIPAARRDGRQAVSDQAVSGQAVIGIVGPVRMDYHRNIALLTRAKHVLEQPLLV